MNFKDDRVRVMHDLDELKHLGAHENLFIIGGAEVYKQTLPFADALLITHIDADYAGDAFFPAINPQEWKLAEERAENENNIGLRFCHYVRA